MKPRWAAHRPGLCSGRGDAACLLAVLKGQIFETLVEVRARGWEVDASRICSVTEKLGTRGSGEGRILLFLPRQPMPGHPPGLVVRERQAGLCLR